jgi:hypothetical protein
MGKTCNTKPDTLDTLDTLDTQESAEEYLPAGLFDAT